MECADAKAHFYGGIKCYIEQCFLSQFPISQCRNHINPTHDYSLPFQDRFLAMVQIDFEQLGNTWERNNVVTPPVISSFRLKDLDFLDIDAGDGIYEEVVKDLTTYNPDTQMLVLFFVSPPEHGYDGKMLTGLRTVDLI